MSWGEARRLTNILLEDPSSALCASMAGWSHPVTYEALVLMDLFDLTHVANADPRKRSQVTPYTRPWPVEKSTKKRHGDPGGRTPEQVKALLAMAARGELLPA